MRENFENMKMKWIIIGLDRRPETKQGIEKKLTGSDREGLGIGLGLGIIDRRSELDRRSEPNTVQMKYTTCFVQICALIIFRVMY